MIPSQGTIIVLIITALSAAGYVGGSNYNTYVVNVPEEQALSEQVLPEIPQVIGVFLEDDGIDHFGVSRVEAPEYVRALYMTAWVGGTRSMRDHVLKLIEDTEANAIVIDIKDDTGTVAFPIMGNDLLNSQSTTSRRIPNIEELIEGLHESGVYVIGRIAVFQDPSYVKKFPDEAVKTASGNVWSDKKGLTWIDAGSENAWDYVATLAEYSSSIGFDEINFDYIRYPTDGNISDMRFSHTGARKKTEVLKSLYEYLDNRLRPQGINISADLFGMVTTNNSGLGIGQIFTDALPHFDAIAPMVYPSHYPNNFAGIASPAKQPYETIKVAMEGAVKQALSIGEDVSKIRPWLQDFNHGAIYTASMVREQMTASYEEGVYSWYMWDASNKYTPSAYKTPEEAEAEYQSYLEKARAKEVENQNLQDSQKAEKMERSNNEVAETEETSENIKADKMTEKENAL